MVAESEIQSMKNRMSCFIPVPHFTPGCTIQLEFHQILLVLIYIYNAWRNLVSFVQFKKREKHPWRSIIFCNTPPWVFITFFKLHKCYQIAQSITFSLE